MAATNTVTVLTQCSIIHRLSLLAATSAEYFDSIKPKLAGKWYTLVIVQVMTKLASAMLQFLRTSFWPFACTTVAGEGSFSFQTAS